MSSFKVIVVGGGPAGVRAAETLVAAGLRPVLIDEADTTGGQIYRRQPANFSRSYGDRYGTEAKKAEDVHNTFDRIKKYVDYRPQAHVWNIYQNNVFVISQERTEAIRFDALIIASGATDRILPLPGWTLPGVYTLGAAQISLKAQACAIGRHIGFVGTGPLLYLVAYQYMKAGADVVGLYDTSPFASGIRAMPKMASSVENIRKGLGMIAALRWAGVPVYHGVMPVSVSGTQSSGVDGIVVRKANGKLKSIACDAVGFGYHLRSETQLADLARCEFEFDCWTRQWLPRIDLDGRSSVSGIYLAGDGVRIRGADAAEVSGQLAAYAALADNNRAIPQSKAESLRRRLMKWERFRQGVALAFPWPARNAAMLPDETIVCRCEMIAAGELRRVAIELEAKELNRAKAFCRLGMGRCQGRFCSNAGAEVLAGMGIPIKAIGRLRCQAPVKPLPMTTALEIS